MCGFSYFPIVLSQVFLDSSPEVEVCPGEIVTLNCTVPASSLRWEIEVYGDEDITAGQSSDFLGPFQLDETGTKVNAEGVVTSITSTVTVTANKTLDGTMITCINPSISGGANSNSTLLVVIGE